MPTPFVKKLASETGKSIEDIEKFWDKAKKITADKFSIPESKFESEQYAYCVGIVKNMVGVDEDLMDPEKFISSDKNAHEYIEDIMTSSGFNIGNVTVAKDALSVQSDPEEVEDHEEDIEVIPEYDTEDSAENISSDHDWKTDDSYETDGGLDPLSPMGDSLKDRE